MKSMETISYDKEVKAKKEHRCNFCGEKIIQGEVYTTSTHKGDGSIYNWKTHTHCSKIASRLSMYDECRDEGVTEEDFQETIHSRYFDLMVTQFEKEDVKKYSDAIQQFRYVRFRDKLFYVIRYYANIDKHTNQ